MVPKRTPGKDEPRPRTSSISCSITTWSVNWPVDPGDPGEVRDVLSVIVPSGFPGGGLTLIPTARKLAVLTSIVALPLTGLFGAGGGGAMAVASLLLLASAISAAR